MGNVFGGRCARADRNHAAREFTFGRSRAGGNRKNPAEVILGRARRHSLVSVGSTENLPPRRRVIFRLPEGRHELVRGR